MRVITAAIQMFLAQARVEAGFLMEFFSLKDGLDPDTGLVDESHQDWKDLRKTMQRLYQPCLDDYFLPAIEAAYNENPFHCFHIAVNISKLRDYTSHHYHYMHWFMTEIERACQLKTNMYLDTQIEGFQTRNDRASLGNVLEPFVHFPNFVEHLFLIQASSKEFGEDLAEIKANWDSEQAALAAHEDENTDDEDGDEESEDEKSSSSDDAVRIPLQQVIGKTPQNMVSSYLRDKEASERAARRVQPVESSKWLLDDDNDEGSEDDEEDEPPVAGNGYDIAFADDGDGEETQRNNYYMMDTLLYKVIVNLFKYLERIARTDIKYQNIVMIENLFQFSNSMCRKRLNEPGSPFNVYVERAMADFTKNASQYFRWLLTRHFRDAMNYFGRIEDMLSKNVASVTEIQYYHCTKEFSENVKLWFSQKSIKNNFDLIAETLTTHLKDAKVLSIVWLHMLEYFLYEYRKYATITVQCFPGESLPQLADEAEAKAAVRNPKNRAEVWATMAHKFISNEFKLEVLFKQDEEAHEENPVAALEIDGVASANSTAVEESRAPAGYVEEQINIGMKSFHEDHTRTSTDLVGE